MTRTFVLGGVAALALAGAVAATAVAQTPAPQAQHRAARADLDQDGRISQAEFVERRLTRLTAMDADRNGAVAREERQAARQTRRAERAGAAFDRLDADKDGSISRAEFEARRASARPMRPARANAQPRPVDIEQVRARTTEAFARLDADRDGYLTREERRAGAGMMRAHRREHRAERRAERIARRAQASQTAPASE